MEKSVNFDRERLFVFMKQNNIDGRPFFYPLSSLPVFESRPENVISYDIFSRGINLPSYHDLRQVDVEYVCSIIRKFLYEN